jgi:hypothetical protein
MGRAAAWVARELAVSAAAPYTNRVADVAETALHAHGVVTSTRDGFGGLRDTGRRIDYHPNRPGGRVIAGGQFWHGGDDRAIALAQIGADFERLQDDLIAHAHTEADATWISSDVAPVIAAWRTFVTRIAKSKLAAYVTEWPVFLAWQGRLILLRSASRARGIHLESPEPVGLPQTVWERATSGNGTSLDTWLTLGKTIVFGAIAVTGVTGLYAMIRQTSHYVKTKAKT